MENDTPKWRAWMKRRRVIWALAIVVALVGVAPLVIPDPTPVEIAETRVEALEVVVQEDGRARIRDRFTLYSPGSGRLNRILLHAGDPVEPDQVLGELVPAEPPLMDRSARAQAEARVAAARAALGRARSAVASSETAVALANQELDRQRSLLDTSTGTPFSVRSAELALAAREEELRSAQYGVRIAEHELAAARALVEAGSGGGGGLVNQVISPIKGRVLRVFERGGGIVPAGIPILDVGDPEQLEVVIDVLSEDAVRIRPGCSVRLENWGGPTLEGRVHIVEPSAFSSRSALGVEEQRLNVVVDIVAPREQWAGLSDGYRVEAEIVVWRGLDVLQVPSGSLIRQDGTWYVFAVQAGKARLKAVEPGEWGDGWTQIRSGLVEGDPVIVYPSGELEDGTPVRAR